MPCKVWGEEGVRIYQIMEIIVAECISSVVVFGFFFTPNLSSAGNSGHFPWVRLQKPQVQGYPFLTVHVVFLCVQTEVQLPVLGIFTVHTDVKTRDCTLGLCEFRKTVCTKS